MENENSVSEQITEDQNTEQVAQETQEEQVQESQYDLEGFNKHFGSNIEDEGSLKDLLQGPSKYEEQLKQKDAELQSALERAKKYDDFIDNADPEKVYGDEEARRFISLRQKFPDKDMSLISQVTSPSFDKLSTLDKIVLAEKFQVEQDGLTDEERRRGILRSLRIDADDVSELTKEDEYVIAKEAAKHNDLFKSIREHKPEEGAYNLTAEIEKKKQAEKERSEGLKNKWEPISKSLLKGFESTKVYDKDDKGNPVEVFSYVVDDGFKEEFADKFLEDLVNSGMEPTEKNAQFAMSYIDDQFRLKNFDKIVREAQKAAKTVIEDEDHNKIHNDREQNTSERQTEKGVPKSIRERFGKSRGN